jgi:hypothetical protein
MAFSSSDPSRYLGHMNRGEKVKDVVEIRPFVHLYDFAADEGLTLASYRFTDITSDLMGRWIERMSDIRPGRGDALALAGFRGVGKSHFVAVLQIIASHAELRSRIQDPHVLARTDLLTKRHLRVASVKRGSGPTMLAELNSALAGLFGLKDDDFGASLNDVLLRASELAGDVPLFIFVDTALERNSRVKRDDGAFLSEMAESAKNLGIFVGITLDDDISGADGPNSSIARSFRIDYLDQEHLYKIVNRHIFVKDHKVVPVLREIYSGFRNSIPGFNWSEERFLSLYPMHPATLEIAPLIRLFIQDFALLGFASEAGVRIMGRPADSLIGLDEMFGNVESKLRKVPELKTAFDHFDTIEREVINKAPVQSRLSAKLSLKGLLLLSLDGQGASSSAIAASMMISEDIDARGASVADILNSFVEAFPNVVTRIPGEGPDARYRLNLGISEGLDIAISHLLSDLGDDDLWESLVRHLAERFPEIQRSENRSGWSTFCTIEWRGSLRRGEIIWFDSDHTVRERNDHTDWRVKISRDHTPDQTGVTSSGNSFVWVVAPLTTDERDIVARYHLLRTNTEIWEKFSEASSTSLNILSTAVEKICQRVFFDNASVYHQNHQYALSCDLQFSHNLAYLFAETFAAIFEKLYPEHPDFVHQLGVKEVSSLVSDFFGDADAFGPHIQDLARIFAEPLGLAVGGANGLRPASKDHLLNLPVIRHVFESNDIADTTLLSDLVPRFLSPPYGLTKESQQLILAALVSQREIEFVTATGNRINHRSLDLHVIWDDVIGIAKPTGKVYSTNQLLSWVRLLTSNPDIGSLTGEGSEALIRDSLESWEREWRSGKILADYDRLADESLTASSWRTAAAVHKSLGPVATFIRSYLDGDIELETCIESVAELFLGSESEFKKKTADLELLKIFTNRAKSHREIYEYLASAEVTDDEYVERLRQQLLTELMEDRHHVTKHEDNIEAAWTDFTAGFATAYITLHARLFGTNDRQIALRELYTSKEWGDFEVYSLISSLDRSAKTKVETRLREYRQMACDLDPAESLRSIPYCSCGLRMAQLRYLEETPHKIRTEIAEFNARSAGTLKSGIPGPLALEDDVLLRSASVAGVMQ